VQISRIRLSDKTSRLRPRSATLQVGQTYEPEVLVQVREWISFDLPTVVLRDTDIIFDLPTIEMRRHRGPDIPETVVRMETRCIGGHPFRVCADVPVVYIEMKESYFDMPVTVMRPVRIVVGLPTVEMRRQDFKMDVPEITMKTADFSADIPYITLRFMKDAGKRTTARAAALAQSAQDAALRSEIGFKDRMRMAVAPLCADMFECFRSTSKTVAGTHRLSTSPRSTSSPRPSPRSRHNNSPTRIRTSLPP